MQEFREQSHRRYNILTGEWVLVSPHRTKRPWKGQQEKINTEKRPSYLEDCYLCKNNTRANGEKNPDYTDTFVFVNDFAALQSGQKPFKMSEGFLQAKSEEGLCKVICFSADHSKSLAEMSITDISKVVNTWISEYKMLIQKYQYIQIFENKGAVMGCSNPHPHGQIWAQNQLPNEVLKKDIRQRNYFLTHNKSLLKTYIEQEISVKERIIFENENFVVLVPFWAIWPFETMIAPKNHLQHIAQLNAINDFAQTIQILTRTYDKLFGCSFPYSMGIHQAPQGDNQTHWHWHMSFYPPLLRSATIKKFMVGYEMFGMPQRDITAEQAAERIQKLV